jgi:hypothetical protein
MKKKPHLVSAPNTLARGLPSNVAASIGRTIARHAYLDWVLASIIHNLLGISIKQGRVAVRLPMARTYVTMVKDLMTFLGISVTVNLNSLYKSLEKADGARNSLAHSIFMRDEAKKLKIQLVRGSWEFGQEYETVKRVLMPEGRDVTREFLKQQRAHVESALSIALQLHREVKSQLRALSEERRTLPAMDRRIPRHT